METFCQLTPYCSVKKKFAIEGKGCRIKLTEEGRELPLNCPIHVTLSNQWGTIYSYYARKFRDQRYVPDGSDIGKKYGVSFFGCSFGAGIGVDDEDTMPNIFAREFDDAEVVNFSHAGYGPQNALEILGNNTGKFPYPREGNLNVGIYAFFTWQLHRVKEGGQVSCTWGGSLPHFRYDKKGRLYRDGVMGDTCFLPSTSVSLLQRSILYRLATGRFWPNPRDQDIRLAADMMIAARDKFRERFHSENYFVLFYPSGGEYGKSEDPLNEKLKAYLEKAKIRYFDYSHLFELYDPQFHFGPDNHPSAPAQRMIGVKLAADLLKELNAGSSRRPRLWSRSRNSGSGRLRLEPRIDSKAVSPYAR